MILPFPTVTEEEQQQRRAIRQAQELRDQQLVIRQLQDRLEKEKRKK